MSNPSTRAVVVALEHFEYGGALVAPGQVCMVRPAEAAALVYQLQARWPHATEALGPHVSPKPEPVKPKRQYRRRDVVAEA